MKRNQKLLKVAIYSIALLLSLSVFGQRIDSTCVDTAAYLNFANTWLGVPYVLGGFSKKGIDCSGLTRTAYKDIQNKEIPKTAKRQYQALTKVPKDSVKTGDLIFFRSKQSPSGWHVGIYLWGEKFLHASSRRTGVIISSLLTGTYYQRIIGFAR